LLEISIVSELKAEQSGGETGSLGAGAAVPNSSDALIDSVMASVQEARSVEAPEIAPDQEAAKAGEPAAEATTAEMPKAEMPKAEMPKAEMPKADPFKVEGVAADASKPDTFKPDMFKPDTSKDEAAKNDAAKVASVKAAPVKAEPPRSPRELLIMSPREGSWKRSEATFESRNAEPKPEKEAPPARNGGRRFAAMAAMLVLAVIAGAAGGAFATIGMSHRAETASATAPNNTALEASVARIDADIMALKAGLEQTTKAGLAQFNKTSDRLERIEKAQVEPNAKLAKLSEAVDKMRAAPPAQAAPTTVATAAPKEVTGTVTAPAGAQPLPMPQASPTAAATGATPKTEVGRLPTVDNWVLRDVSHGSALIEGRTGLYEVFAGDPVPGLGRVEAIRKQDGRWVVVTPKGLIVAR
jgi:hypothetical protein